MSAPANRTVAEIMRAKRTGRFVALWSLAVFATATAFILYLALRSRAVELGYKAGRARARQAQLRETRRVLQVEAVAYRNPERVEALAKGVLQLEEPPPQRIFVVGAPIEATEKQPKVMVAPSASVSASAAASGAPGAPASPANAPPADDVTLGVPTNAGSPAGAPP
jgi:biotin carboxylase